MFIGQIKHIEDQRQLVVFMNCEELREAEVYVEEIGLTEGIAQEWLAIDDGLTRIASRLKRSGMFWTVRGANAILAFRCSHLSGRFEDYWEGRRAA